MSERSPETDPRDPGDGRTEVIRTEEVRATGTPAPPPPHPAEGDAVVEAGPRVVREDERVRVREDGTVERSLDRVEEQPVRRRPVEHLGPWLLFLLLLVLGGIAAAWYLTREETSPVPGVTGQPLDAAVAELQEKGFKADIASEPSDEQEGTVFEQDPAAGTELEDGSTVRVVVSEGPATVAVPNAVGLTETEARDRMAEAGFKVNVAEVFSDEQEEGRVIAQNPPAGEEAEPDSIVRINVSKGPGTVTVPDLVGLTRADAESQLDELGLEANVVEVPSAQPRGTVVAQNPAAGEARVGSAVRLNVSTGGT